VGHLHLARVASHLAAVLFALQLCQQLLERHPQGFGSLQGARGAQEEEAISILLNPLSLLQIRRLDGSTARRLDSPLLPSVLSCSLRFLAHTTSARTHLPLPRRNDQRRGTNFPITASMQSRTFTCGNKLSHHLPKPLPSTSHSSGQPAQEREATERGKRNESWQQCSATAKEQREQCIVVARAPATPRPAHGHAVEHQADAPGRDSRLHHTRFYLRQRASTHGSLALSMPHTHTLAVYRLIALTPIATLAAAC